LADFGFLDIRECRKLIEKDTLIEEEEQMQKEQMKKKKKIKTLNELSQSSRG
jgi:hypothetical protein